MTAPLPATLSSVGAWNREFFHHPQHGPLPALLTALTIVTGLIDSVSVLALGRVFVANMTGNVVFIGFAIAGAPGFSLAASVAALAGFLVGAGAGGTMARRVGVSRGRLLLRATAAQSVLLIGSAVALTAFDQPYGSALRSAVATVCALALGLQNATVRKLAVPDFTTTVLTMTITGLAADVRAHQPAAVARRLVTVVAMFGGALGGAALVLHDEAPAAVYLAGGVTAAVGVFLARSVRRDPSWG